MMKKAVFFVVLAFGLSLVLTGVGICGMVGNSDVGQWYLVTETDGVNPNLYPDAVGKITFNCSTGQFVLRAHALEAGRTFTLKSNSIALGDEVAVGNGESGNGNNVLITGTAENVCDLTDGRWNLWDGGTKFLRSLPDDKIHCPQCQ